MVASSCSEAKALNDPIPAKEADPNTLQLDKTDPAVKASENRKDSPDSTDSVVPKTKEPSPPPHPTDAPTPQNLGKDKAVEKGAQPETSVQPINPNAKLPKDPHQPATPQHILPENSNTQSTPNQNDTTQEVDQKQPNDWIEKAREKTRTLNAINDNLYKIEPGWFPNRTADLTRYLAGDPATLKESEFEKKYNGVIENLTKAIKNYIEIIDAYEKEYTGIVTQIDDLKEVLELDKDIEENIPDEGAAKEVEDAKDVVTRDAVSGTGTEAQELVEQDQSPPENQSELDEKPGFFSKLWAGFKKWWPMGASSLAVLSLVVGVLTGTALITGMAGLALGLVAWAGAAVAWNRNVNKQVEQSVAGREKTSDYSWAEGGAIINGFSMIAGYFKVMIGMGVMAAGASMSVPALMAMLVVSAIPLLWNIISAGRSHMREADKIEMNSLIEKRDEMKAKVDKGPGRKTAVRDLEAKLTKY